MTLEQEAWRASGGAAPPTRPPSTWDRVARAIAWILLILIAGASAWVLIELTPFGYYAILGAVVLGLVRLGFRVRELSRDLDAARARIEALEAKPSEERLPPP